MDEINAFTEAGVVYFHATNISEYNELVQLAEKQAQQLKETVARLSNFKFQFKFSQMEKKE